jgi:TRAP-type uncharacterized transport system fused permease subunit
MQTFMTFLTCFLGTITFSMVTMGYYKWATNIAEWIIAAAGTIILLFPRVIHGVTSLEIPIFAIDAIAISLFVLVHVLQKLRIKKDPTLTLPLEQRRELRAKRRNLKTA